MNCQIKYSTEEILEIQKRKGSQLWILIDHVVHTLYECRSFTNMVKKFVTTNNGQKEDASDIIHDALLALVLTLKNNKFKGKSSIENYTFSICKKMWLSKLKSAHFKRTTSVGLQLGHETATNETPLSKLETIEKKEILWEIISHLGSQCKELLKMMSLDFSHKEIAIKFNWDVEKSRKQRSKCKKSLEDLIKNNKNLFF